MGLFDDVISALHPDVIVQRCYRPNDEARGCYVVQNTIAKSYPDFCSHVIDYTNHHHNYILGMRLANDLALDKGRNFLEQGDSGWDSSVVTALSGDQGGLLFVFDNINLGFKYEHERAYRDFIFDSFLDPLDFQQITTVMTEFQQKLGRYCPPSFNLIPPGAMSADYKKILWQYIQSIRRNGQYRQW